MGAKKISALSDAALPLAGDERLAGVQGGATVGFTVADALQAPFAAAGSSVARRLASRCADAVNVRDFGAGQGDAAADTAAIKAAYAAAVTIGGVPAVWFPPGSYGFKDDTRSVLTNHALFYGEGATIVFSGSGVWQFGDGSATVGFPEIRDLTIAVNSDSSVTAPIDCYNCGRVYFQRVTWSTIKTSAINHRTGVLFLRHCDIRSSVTSTAMIASLAGAIFIQGGRFDGGQIAGQWLVSHTGAGQIDGMVFKGVSTTQLNGVYSDTSSGHLANVMALGCLFDQVDQKAFNIAMAAGGSLSDLSIVGCKFNGWGGSTATAGALISIDLTSGATHSDYAILVESCVLANCRRRAVEILGGTFSRVVLSNNMINQYGTSASTSSRGFYIKGTFDYLEVADNRFSTSYAHHYGIEFDTVTATQAKEQGNSFAGTAATLANRNTTAFQSDRPLLTANRTYYVRTDGSDSNAGLVNSAAGGFLTIQKAFDAICGLDLNGFTATIQLADGAYTAGLIPTKAPIGAGSIIIRGNSSTPTNVTLTTTSTDCFRFNAAFPTPIIIRDMQLGTVSSGYGVRLLAACNVSILNLVFGVCVGPHMSAEACAAQIVAISNYSITGGSNYHIQAVLGGQIILDGRTVTIIGTPPFAAFALVAKVGYVSARSMTFSGVAAGQRYSVASGGIIDTNTGNTSYLPGTTSGGATAPGYYL